MKPPGVPNVLGKAATLLHRENGEQSLARGLTAELRHGMFSGVTNAILAPMRQKLSATMGVTGSNLAHHT